MGLQIWLPLIGDMHNQGMSGVTVTSTSATVDANGKIGSCMKIVDAVDLYYAPDFGTGSFSFCGWFKFNKAEITTKVSTLTINAKYKQPTGNLIGNNSYGGIGITWNANNVYADGAFNSMSIMGTIRTSTISARNTGSFAVSFDTWIHIALTWNVETKTLSLYKNGVHHASTTTPDFSDAVIRALNVNYSGVWSGNGPGTTIPFRANDIRVYDHCLSDKEIREIANGLILNYRFSSPLTDASSNLVRNGFGNMGYENWANTNASTDVPSASTATKSFYNNNTTEGIPIVPDHQYTLSGYVKRYGTTTTASRMSIIPYDADKLRIQNYHSNGFLTATTTTLAKDLNSGDTVVYVTSAANWVTSGSNSEFIAIFGYTDGSGYVWPDMVYTRYCYYITKESINKTNNTIPLTSAYNGPKRLKGTTVCQSTAGSTYYYPRTVGTAYTQDWYYYTISFVPKDVQYIKAAKYFLIAAISSTMMAAITLKDDNAQNLICDSSGLQNNGQIVGTGNTGILSGGARGDFSLYIEDGRTNCVKANLKMPLYAITMSCWFKSTNTSPYGSFHILMATGTQYEMDVSGSGNFRSGFAINGARTVSDYGSGNLLDGKWHMLTHSFDGTTIKRYIDGVEVNSTSKSGTLDGSVLDLYIGRFGTQTGYGITKGYVSDVRIYATALSAEQVKELYNVGGSVDNKGNVFTYELKEN